MKRNVFAPFLFVAVLALTVGLACGIDFGTKTPEPPPPAVIQPTSAPLQQPPTPQEIVQPTMEPPASVSEQYFTADFNEASAGSLTGKAGCAPSAPCPTEVLSNWNYFIVKDSNETKESGLTLKVASGYLTFDINSRYLYAYLTYTAHTYQDVTVEARAENRGVNNNNVSLICRYSPTEGWYEFNIANNGLYWIYAATINKEGKVVYNRMVDGGSNFIKQGKDVNEYKAVCEGRVLTLYINGQEVKTWTDNKYVLREGQVGFSLSSFSVLPAIIDLDWFKIAQP